MLSKTQSVKMTFTGADGKKEQREVGVATYHHFEVISEAIDTLGEAKTLEYINAQTRTNEMNRVRGMQRSGPTKTVLTKKAMERITAEEWMGIAGKPEAIEALIESKIEEIREELQAAAVGVGAPVEGDED